jgi:hypothetical protein
MRDFASLYFLIRNFFLCAPLFLAIMNKAVLRSRMQQLQQLPASFVHASSHVELSMELSATFLIESFEPRMCPSTGNPGGAWRMPVIFAWKTLWSCMVAKRKLPR